MGRSTVGLILNGRGDELGIPQRTQKKAIDIARRLGYRPNSLALGLAGKHTQTIGVLLPSGSFYPQYLMSQALSLRLHRKGYQTYLVDSLQDPEVVLESLKEMATRRVDGIIFYANTPFTPEIRKVLAQFRVVVLITNMQMQENDLPAHIIYRNTTPAIDDIVEHFAKSGRRHPMIATLVEPSNNDKIEQFKNALRRHGFDSSDEAAVFDAACGIPRNSDYYAKFMEKFQAGKLEARRFDAIFCTCDEGALAAVNYLAKRDIQVPRDVVVVGMNNTPWAQGMQPPLASASWGHENTFDVIESRLVERLGHPDAEPKYEELPLKFIWRESAG